MLKTDMVGIEAIKIAAEKGGYDCDFSVYPIFVESGSITLHGTNGTISFLPENKICVELPGVSGVFPCSDYTREQGFGFSFSSSWPFVFWGGKLAPGKYEAIRDSNAAIRQAIEAKDSEQVAFLRRKLFALQVPVESNDDYIFINLKVTFSSDFKGSCGSLDVLSNWYNGKN